MLVAFNQDILPVVGQDIELLKIAMRHLELVSNHIFRQGMKLVDEIYYRQTSQHKLKIFITKKCYFFSNG